MRNRVKKSILLVILVLLLILGISGLYMEFREYEVGEEEYYELEQYANIDVEYEKEITLIDNTSKELQLASNQVKIDFNELKKINSDCIGWIRIPNTNINYPIVNGIDNNFYVTHTFRRNKNKSGAIFTDMRNSLDFSDKNTIIYGHNLKNNKMFSDLRKFLDKSYFDRHKKIIVYRPDKELIYEVISVYKTMENSNTYKVKFASSDAFLSHLEMLVNNSEIKTSKEIQDIDKIITLSTCTNNLEGERIVVIAKLIEEIKE